MVKLIMRILSRSRYYRQYYHQRRFIVNYVRETSVENNYVIKNINGNVFQQDKVTSAVRPINFVLQYA